MDAVLSVDMLAESYLKTVGFASRKKDREGDFED